jgi:hypothetical protein
MPEVQLKNEINNGYQVKTKGKRHKPLVHSYHPL